MLEKIKQCVVDKLRMSQWLALALLLYLVAPVLSAVGMVQLSTVVWKVGHLTVAAHVGYWIDRNAFGDRITPASSDTQKLRRAIVIGCALLAMALGM